MALALLSSVTTRLIQILNANRSSYSSSVGTGASGKGAYPFQQEVVDAAIQADGLTISEGYFQSRKAALRNRFFVDSANLADGAKLPEFDGIIGKAEWSTDGVTWKPSQEAQSKDDVVQAKQVGAGYVGTAAFYGLHFFEDGYIFHTSPFFRISYPAYTKTTALQANENHEPLIIAWACELLYKEAANAPFEWYQRMRIELLERVINGDMRLRAVRPLPPEMRGDQ